MITIESAQLVWDNGKVTNWDVSSADRQKFKYATGANSVTAFRWVCGGRSHQVPGHVFLLPDRSGVVSGGADNGTPGEIFVINADGTVRFRLKAPISVPGMEGLSGAVHIELPTTGWPAGRIAFGPIACFTSQPSLPVMLDLDWASGSVRGAQSIPRAY